MKYRRLSKLADRLEIIKNKEKTKRDSKGNIIFHGHKVSKILMVGKYRPDKAILPACMMEFEE